MKLSKISKVDRLKTLFRGLVANEPLDAVTIEYICEMIDSFSLTSTFSTYYSAFVNFVDWCVKKEHIWP